MNNETKIALGLGAAAVGLLGYNFWRNNYAALSGINDVYNYYIKALKDNNLTENDFAMLNNGDLITL